MLKEKFSYFFVLLLLITSSFAKGTSKIQSNLQEKPRVVVTCDPELDDSNSLVRFLLFSTDYKVEGLVYSSSQYHWKGDGKGTTYSHPNRGYNTRGVNLGSQTSWRWAANERFIDEAVDIYAEVYPNLKVHNPEYPTPAYLKSVVRFGNIEFEGDYSKDTPGSDLIKSLALDDQPGPLFVTAWGGQSTIARALKSIEEQYSKTPEWNAIKEKVSKKVMILPSGEQDDSYKEYIKPNWPNIGYSQLGGADLGLAYMAQTRAKAEHAHYYTPEWMAGNITSKGPFGAFYRVWGDGKQMVKGDFLDYFGLSGYTDEELKKMGYIVWCPVQKKGSFLGEGDTGTFLNLIGNGLRAWEDENYGGWSGRKRNTPPVDFATLMANPAAMEEFRKKNVNPDFPDFLPACQNGLASRFQWSVTQKYKNANHDPVIDAPLALSAKPGQKVELKAKVSDPDGNKVTVRWMQFKGSSYKGDVVAENPSSAKTSVVIPADVQPGQTIHMVMEAVDNGKPALTHYHRTIITVR